MSDQGRHRVTVNHLAHLQPGQRAEVAAALQGVFQVRCGQATDVHCQSAGIVLAACFMGRLNERPAGVFSAHFRFDAIGGQPAQRDDLLLREPRVNTVTQQHEAVTGLQLALRIVHAHGIVLPNVARVRRLRRSG